MTHPPIGIDLGTTFSALAVINSAGHPEIVPNAGGERLTASVVYFEASAMDKPVVGQNALAAAGGFPDRVVRSMKRHMGEPDWRFTVDSREYSAVDISSLILKKVIQDAAETLGSLEYAVITIPAYFGELRHQTTKQAAEQAGIKVLRLINEPTAAALAYARAGHTLGKVLIYDYGGGTFDVTLAEIRSETEVEVIASAGDPALGGDDLDKALMKHLDSIFAKEYSISLIESGAAAKHNLRTTAEQAKKNLSELNEVHGVQLSWNNNFLNVSVSREEFEALIESQISQTEMLVEIVLSEAGMKPEDVDHVLLVGGSTRIPAVKRMLKKKFAQEPRASINGDEVVALGASIQAAIIMQERDLYQTPSMKGFELQDVTNFSYGTTALDHQTHQPINSIIIPKNTPIPHERTESFYTTHQGQTEINCRVTQGEGTDPEFVEVMANQVLSLPPDRPPNCEVKVTFSYDASGIMAAKFLDVESGRQSDLDIRIEGSDDGSENGSDDSSGAADGPDLQDDDGIDDLLL